jgi:hypothetical protein
MNTNNGKANNANHTNANSKGNGNH